MDKLGVDACGNPLPCHPCLDSLDKKSSTAFVQDVTVGGK